MASTTGAPEGWVWVPGGTTEGGTDPGQWVPNPYATLNQQPGPVAPPVGRIIVAPVPRPECPWLVVQGDRDELVDVTQVRRWVDGYTPPPKCVVLEGAEHFFHGRLGDLRAAVLEFLSGELAGAA